jgi:hypothetical protein
MFGASTFGRRFSLDAGAKIVAQSQERTEGGKRTKYFEKIPKTRHHIRSSKANGNTSV